MQTLHPVYIEDNVTRRALRRGLPIQAVDASTLRRWVTAALRRKGCAMPAPISKEEARAVALALGQEAAKKKTGKRSPADDLDFQALLDQQEARDLHGLSDAWSRGQFEGALARFYRQTITPLATSPVQANAPALSSLFPLPVYAVGDKRWAVYSKSPGADTAARVAQNLRTAVKAPYADQHIIVVYWDTEHNDVSFVQVLPLPEPKRFK